MAYRLRNVVLLLSVLLFISCKTNYKDYYSKTEEEKEVILINAVKKGKNFVPQKLYFSNRDYLEFSGGGNYPCIGIRITRTRNKGGLATYIEIKKQGKNFIDVYENQYKSVEEALEKTLKGIVWDYYHSHQENADEIWNNFIKDGNLKKFIDTCKKEIIDRDFLESPFNDLYG